MVSRRRDTIAGNPMFLQADILSFGCGALAG
jgi:hypothetical protein